MPRYRVCNEAYAAICIEIEMEAPDRETAERLGKKWLAENQETCAAIVENLVNVDDIATRGYAQTLKLPVVKVEVSGPTDGGFEVTHVNEMEDITHA